MKNQKFKALWWLFYIGVAAVVAVCIYVFAVALPAKREAERLALEEQRKQWEEQNKDKITPGATVTPTDIPVEPTATAIPTEAPTNIPTEEPTPTSTPVPTNTPVPTAANTPTPEPTATNTPTPVPTATNTPTPEPTATNTPTPKPTATSTPTPKPTNTPTPKPTSTPTPTPSPLPEFEFTGRVKDSITLENENPKDIRFSIKNKTDNLVVDVYSTNDYAVNAYLSGGTTSYKVELFGRESGTAQIVFHLYGTDENGNKNTLYDTHTILVTVDFVEEEKLPFPDCPILENEWKYGEDITVQVWSNGLPLGLGGGYARMRIFGTGEMWTVKEANKNIDISSPWLDSDYCTYYDHHIKEVVIEEGVTYIRSIGIQDLANVTFPSTLKGIGKQCFRYAALKEVILPEGLEVIESNAFARIEELEKVSLPSTLTTIEYGAFANDQVEIYPWDITNNLLKQIVIPKSVTCIGRKAFNSRWGTEIILEDGIDMSGFEKEWDYSTDIEYLRWVEEGTAEPLDRLN